MKHTVANILAFILLTSALLAAAEADTAAAKEDSVVGWQTSLSIDFTTNQSSYSNSWTGGSTGSLSWVANMDGAVEKALSPNVKYKSTLRLSFGQTVSQNIHTDDQGVETKAWEKPKKSTDKIDWENIALFAVGKTLEPYFGVRVQSEFLDASSEHRNFYFSPIELTESIGLAHYFYQKDEDFVTLRLGFGLRQMMRRSTDSTLTVFDTTLIDGGLESIVDARINFGETLSYVGKLTVFRALFFSEKDVVEGTPAENYWKSIDINWETSLNAYITKLVTVKLYTQFLYDKEISIQGRFKETLGIGLTYRFI